MPQSVLIGLIVYNRVIVYKRQIFLKEVVRVIIIDQCNHDIQVTVIYSRAFFLSFFFFFFFFFFLSL